ncbi:MAG: hypothetical protein RBS30_07105, partial [Sphaerochaetaceae bacterium]|nr:hypothetical protein [Sphaerochaetaceae bacterium]
MNKYLRITGLALHTFLSISLVVLAGQASLRLLFANPGAGTTAPVPLQVFGRELLPALIIALISLAGSFSIALKDTSRMVMERRMLPLLFLTHTLCFVKIIPIYSLLVPVSIISFSTVAVLYQFALVFSAFLVFAIGLFQQGSNMFKSGQLVFIGAFASLLLAALADVSANSKEVIVSGAIASSAVLMISALLQMIAIGSFIVIFLKEKTRHNALRCGGFILMILANMGIAVSIASGWKIL